MKAPANCRLIGRWRIVESDLWDRAHLDLSGRITAQGGEIAFGALEAGLEVEYARDSIGSRLRGLTDQRDREPFGFAISVRRAPLAPTPTIGQATPLEGPSGA